MAATRIENLTRLSSRHRRVAELALQGKTVKEIAGSVGSEPRHIANWLTNHPIIKALVNQQLSADAQINVIRSNHLLQAAVGVTAEMMGRDQDPRTRLAAAGLAVSIHRQIAGSIQQAQLVEQTEGLRMQLEAVLNPAGRIIDIQAMEALDPLLEEVRAMPSAQ